MIEWCVQYSKINKKVSDNIFKYLNDARMLDTSCTRWELAVQSSPDDYTSV